MTIASGPSSIDALLPRASIEMPSAEHLAPQNLATGADSTPAMQQAPASIGIAAAAASQPEAAMHSLSALLANTQQSDVTVQPTDTSSELQAEDAETPAPMQQLAAEVHSTGGQEDAVAHDQPGMQPSMQVQCTADPPQVAASCPTTATKEEQTSSMLSQQVQEAASGTGQPDASSDHALLAAAPPEGPTSAVNAQPSEALPKLNPDLSAAATQQAPTQSPTFAPEPALEADASPFPAHSPSQLAIQQDARMPSKAAPAASDTSTAGHDANATSSAEATSETHQDAHGDSAAQRKLVTEGSPRSSNSGLRSATSVLADQLSAGLLRVSCATNASVDSLESPISHLLQSSCAMLTQHEPATSGSVGPPSQQVLAGLSDIVQWHQCQICHHR